MPIYDVQAPDGKVYSIQGPEGATAEQLGQVIGSQSAESPAPPSDRGLLPQISDAVTAGIHHFNSGIHGAAQFVENAIDAGAQHIPKNPVSDYIHKIVTSDNAALAQREKDYQASVPDSTGAYIGATAGEVAPFMFGGVANGLRAVGDAVGNASLKVAPEAKQLAQGLGGGAQGAVVAATQPVTSGDYWDTKKDQGLVGVAGGAVAPSVIKGITSVIAPQASAAYKAVADSGVTTTIGQRLGGALNTIEEKSQSIPVIGDFISQARNRSPASWNKATLNDVVAPIGETVSQIGHGGVAEAGDKLSQAYNKGKEMLGGFKLDEQCKNGLKDLQDGVASATNLTPQGKRAFNQMLDMVKQNISPNGSILADGFKELDSKLSKEVSSYSGSLDAYQKNLGDAFKQLQSVITDNAKRANPEAAKLLDSADEGWAKLVRVEAAAKASSGNKSNTGIFTPGQLMSAVRSTDDSVRGRATARGDALMQDWAQNGLKVLGDKVPNSGTFDRTANAALIGALSQNLHYIPPALLAATAGAGGYSPLGQRLAVKIATDRPPQAIEFAKALKKYIPLSAP